MATQTMSKDDILEAIGNMSVFELAELIEAFKGKFGVTIAAPAAAPAGAGAAGAAAAGPAGRGKKGVPLVLHAGGGEKNQVIKGGPGVTRLRVIEGEDLGEGAPREGKGGGA